MREKIIASMLLVASCAFAQFESQDNSAFSNNNNSSFSDNSNPYYYADENATYGEQIAPAQAAPSAPQQANNNIYYTTNTQQNDPFNTNNGNQYYTNTPNNGNQYYTNNPSKQIQDPYYHNHRGFYFVTSLTLGFTTLSHSETDDYDGEDIERTYKGIVIPYEEIRIGGSIASTVSIYAALGIGVGTGTYEYEKNKYSTDSRYNPPEYENKKYDATHLKFRFGGGLEFYPIKDVESAGHGFFFGVTAGFSIEGAFYEDEDEDYYYDYDTNSDSEEFINFFCRFEIGKDWWFGRRWSFGVSANYTYGALDDGSSYHYKDEFSAHTFGVTIRLAH